MDWIIDNNSIINYYLKKAINCNNFKLESTWYYFMTDNTSSSTITFRIIRIIIITNFKFNLIESLFIPINEAIVFLQL